jgi:cytochrome P450
MAHASVRFFSRRLRVDPYGAYAELRTAPGPHRSPVGAWVVGRYDDVRTMLTSPRSSSQVWMLADEPTDEDASPPGPRSLFGPRRGDPTSERAAHLMRDWLPLTDPPQHPRLRRALAGALTDQLTGRMRTAIDEIVTEVVQRLPDGEPVDLVEAFAREVPQRVTAALIGIPETEVAAVAGWSVDVGRALSPFLSRTELVGVEASLSKLQEYVEGLVSRRRSDPGDDLVSGLLDAQAEHELSDAELASLVLFVLAASQETTSAALAAAVHLLATHPAALGAVQTSGRWRDAVEEALRFESPVQMTLRRLTADEQVGEVTVPAGAHVVVVLGAANRDPAAFPEPERFDPGRGGRAHLAFGVGPHACPGAAIAQVELQAALRGLFDEFDSVQLDGEPELEPSLTMRSRRRLPVRLHRRGS